MPTPYPTEQTIHQCSNPMCSNFVNKVDKFFKTKEGIVACSVSCAKQLEKNQKGLTWTLHL